MKNSDDAAMLSSADGQARLAAAIAQGIARFLS
ncbi:N-acetylmuramoyl-L-alanine amidase [Mycobacteroides abscessus subsp. massiliense]|nr:N-acetylmuramoyl-L-alanine amidase [Mycobacteroides abscessus subsp. massiliense]